MIQLGSPAPDFSLPEPLTSRLLTLKDFQGKQALLVMFICNHCPYVIHVNQGIVALAKDYQEKGVGFVAISSNDVENYPADAPDKMKVHAGQEGYTFPYLYDETQEVAKAYDAACTPDFYVFDGNRRLVYRGQMDGSRPGSGVPVTGEDLRAALDAVLAGGAVTDMQRPSAGCNIKWKKQ